MPKRFAASGTVYVALLTGALSFSIAYFFAVFFYLGAVALRVAPQHLLPLAITNQYV